LKRDPIAEAHRQWVEHGWEDSANGMAAVTSIMRVHQVFLSLVDEVLSPMDLTFARYELMAVLYFTKRGELPLAKLGARLQVHQTSVTNLVDRLEKQGYINRIPHPTDRRSTFAQITTAGRQIVRKATPRLNEAFAALPLSNDKTQMLVSILAELRGAWGDFETEGAPSLATAVPDADDVARERVAT
jgi:DNA-binding MarR family transcriptional regulator